LNLVEGIDMSFGPAVTNFRDFVEYFLAVSALVFKNYNKERLKTTLNENLELFIESRRKFGAKLQQKFVKTRLVFCLGICLKLVKTVLFFSTYFVVVDVWKVKPVYFVPLLIPNLAVFVISNEFCFGVLALKFHLEVINELLRKSDEKLRNTFSKNLQKLQNDLEVCDSLDEISQMHSKVFKIHRTFMSMYQVQFLILIFTTFISLILDFFYITSIKLYSLFNVSGGNGDLLARLSLIMIPLRCTEMLWHLKTCNQVSLLSDENQKIVNELESYGSDRRVKDSVSLMKNQRLREA
jgi:hypothetical protein